MYVGNKLTCKQIIAIANCNGFVHTVRVRQQYRTFADRYTAWFGNDRPFAGVLACHRFAFQLANSPFYADYRAITCDLFHVAYIVWFPSYARFAASAAPIAPIGLSTAAILIFDAMSSVFRNRQPSALRLSSA